MAFEVVCLYIRAEIGKREPLKPEIKKALEAFFEAATNYHQQVAVPVRQRHTPEQKQAFMQTDHARQWNEMLTRHIQHLKSLGINFAVFSPKDIQEAFIQTYPTIRSNLK